MRIIKEGKKIIGVMRVTCYKCDAELEIEASDLKEESSSLSTTYSYECACCHRKNHLAYNELPEEITFDMMHKK